MPVIEAINEPEKENEPEKAIENTLKEAQNDNKAANNEEIKPDFSDKIILPSQPEIEKIVILYKNKSFKEYYPSL